MDLVSHVVFRKWDPAEQHSGTHEEMLVIHCAGVANSVADANAAAAYLRQHQKVAIVVNEKDERLKDASFIRGSCFIWHHSCKRQGVCVRCRSSTDTSSVCSLVHR